MELDKTFRAFFDKVKEDKRNVCVAVYITDFDEEKDKTRVAMQGRDSDILAAICLAIHSFCEKTQQSTNKVLLDIAGVLSEEK